MLVSLSGGGMINPIQLFFQLRRCSITVVSFSLGQSSPPGECYTSGGRWICVSRHRATEVEILGKRSRDSTQGNDNAQVSEVSVSVLLNGHKRM